MHSWNSSLCLLHHSKPCLSNTPQHKVSSRPRSVQITGQLPTAENFNDGDLLREEILEPQPGISELLNLCFPYQISLLLLLMIIIISSICIMPYRLQSMFVCIISFNPCSLPVSSVLLILLCTG